MIDPFMAARESEKRGGAGTMSDIEGWDSGKNVAGGSNIVRTTSVGVMGDGCRDLW